MNLIFLYLQPKKVTINSIKFLVDPQDHYTLVCKVIYNDDSILLIRLPEDSLKENQTLTADLINYICYNIRQTMETQLYRNYRVNEQEVYEEILKSIQTYV